MWVKDTKTRLNMKIFFCREQEHSKEKEMGSKRLRGPSESKALQV